MARPARIGLTLVALAAGPAFAAEPAEPDPVLEGLVDQALQARPELAQGRAEVRAAAERVPQASAMPEPMLQVGVQNDSFTSWQVGQMPTSWVLFMATETFPFPGKLSMRSDLAQAEVVLRQVRLERLRLSTVAQVRRAYVGLQLTRERVALLGKLSGVWATASSVAQSRYEAGDGAQSDVLRAHLEGSRLQQRRLLLELEERSLAQVLNRLRGHPLGEPIETTRRLSQFDFPQPPDEAQRLQQARLRSPELLAARAGVERAAQQQRLADRSWYPDFTVGAGVMVRGALEPMWTVTVGVPVPVFGASRQARSAAEASELSQAGHRDVESVEQLLALRTHQRLDRWRTLREVWSSYQQGLLVQAEATADSTLGQYRVGRVSFAAVLEANAVSIAETESALLVLADGWQLAIADEELALDEPSAAPQAGAPAPGSWPTGM